MKVSHVVLVLVAVVALVIGFGLWSGILSRDPMTNRPVINTDRIPASLVQQESGERNGCKSVNLIRPNVDPTRPDITLRFRDIGTAKAVSEIAGCNPTGTGTVLRVEQAQSGGVRVRVTTVKGVATIRLPLALANGSVDQVVCNSEGDKFTHRKYAQAWASGLPSEIRLNELTSYDKAAADKGCAAAAQ